MHDRKPTGNVNSLLRADPKADNWLLEVLPIKKDWVAAAEGFYIKILQPSLNVQQPYTDI